MNITSEKIEDLSILITGGAGFIGSHLAEHFVKAGAKKIVVLDDLSTGFEKNISKLFKHDNFEFIKGSIVDLVTCKLACKGIDVVLHHAALGSVPRSIENPMATNEVNVSGFVNMLHASHIAGVKKFIYASSSSVYGDDMTFPKTESKTGNLLSPYAVTKHTNEKYASVFSSLYGLKTVGFRYFNVFGERQNPAGAYAAVIPKFIDSLLNDKSPTIFGTGNNTRDFTYVGNVVLANTQAVLNNKISGGTVMNIACGGTISVNDIFNHISGFLAASLKPTYCPERKGEIKDSYADISYAKNGLNYEPQITVIDGLERTVEWFKSQMA
ncbi:MAG: SDR family oxidoreductase [Bacteroidota bacterium]